MKQYWISVIVQGEEDRRAWSIAFTDSVSSIEAGMEAIHKARKNYTVLSAWIDTFDENNVKHTVFHECYIDVFGYVQQEDGKYVRI